MSITDELREYARPLHNVWYNPLSNVYTHTTMDIAPSLDAIRLDEYVLAIADRIDAEHEKECSESWMRGHDAWAAVANEDLMAEHGWVRLPVDAGGEVIHVGDTLVSHYDGRDYVREVEALIFTDRWDFELSDEDGDTRDIASLRDFYLNTRHYHAPTVEDVLRECIANVCRSNVQLHEQGCPPLTIEDIDSELDEYINEYAAKLRLAGDSE